MDQIFNELSANGGYPSKHAASIGVQSLINLSKSLSNIGYSQNLRITEEFSQLMLARDYTILDWAKDHNIGVNRDQQRWLLTTATKAPYANQLLHGFEKDRLVEFRYGNQQCTGLGLAFLCDTVTLSFDCDDRFTKSPISIQFYQIEDNAESEDTVNVVSVYQASQIQSLRLKMEQSCLAEISTGSRIIEMNCDVFQCLSIGSGASKQLNSLTGNEIFFREMVRHFFVLNQTMQMWTGGVFNPCDINWSPESDSTLEQFGKSRSFLCPDGETRVFSFHTKIISANQRIYFFPCFEKRIVYVGYVGKHLQTAKYKI